MSHVVARFSQVHRELRDLAEDLQFQPRKQLEISHVAGQQCKTMMNCRGGNQRIVRAGRQVF